jgi:hypothetical protein
MTIAVYNGLDLKNQRIVNLSDPSTSTDAATKQYVDNLVQGMSWKQPVRAASTANVTVATPGTTLDGVTLAVNDRVLLKDQTTTSQNGIWVWTASGSPLTRAVDANTTPELRNATTYVSEGTVNADRAYVQTTEVTTVDTTAQTWVQTGGGTTYTAGNGLSLASTTFSVQAVASGGISVVAGGVQLDTAIAVRKFAANVGDGTSTTLTVTHNLNTQDVTVMVRDATTNAMVLCDIIANGVNTVQLTFATAPTSNQFRCVVHA